MDLLPYISQQKSFRDTAIETQSLMVIMCIYYKYVFNIDSMFSLPIRYINQQKEQKKKSDDAHSQCIINRFSTKCYIFELGNTPTKNGINNLFLIRYSMQVCVCTCSVLYTYYSRHNLKIWILQLR